MFDERPLGGSDGVYPTHLERNDGQFVDRPLGLDTDNVCATITFLDLEATLKMIQEIVRFHWKLFDKRNQMKIFEGMRKFPHPDTVLDGGVKGRVLPNEVGRYDIRTSSVKDFRAAVLQHCQSFLDHGYGHDEVSRQVASYPVTRDKKGNWPESRTFIQKRVKRMKPNSR